MIRPFVAGCAALLLFLAAPAAHALETCDPYGRGTFQETTDALALYLFKATPMRDVDTARDLRIEIVNEPKQFGPYATRKDGRNYIGVPRGFLLQLCNLVLVSAFDPEPAGIAAKIDACLSRGSTPQACVDEALVEHLPAAERRYALRSALQRRVDQELVESAIGFLMMHELGHVALQQVGRTFTPAQRREAEFEADLYAARYSVLVQGAPTGPAIVFDILSRVKAFNGSGVGTHDSYYCRRENVFNIAAISDLIPTALNILPGSRVFKGRPDTSEIIAKRRATLRKVAAGEQSSGLAVRFSPQCRVKGYPQLEAVQRDLVKLAVFQDGVADALPGPTYGRRLVTLLTDLMALPLETADGRAIRVNLVVAYADNYRRTRSSALVTAFLLDVATSPDMNDARATDVAAIHIEGALRILYFPRDGKQNKEGYDAILSALRLAFELSEVDHEILLALARYGAETKDCELIGHAFKVAETLGADEFLPEHHAQLQREAEGAKCDPGSPGRMP